MAHLVLKDRGGHSPPQALVNQLDTPPDPALNHADVQLEADRLRSWRLREIQGLV